ncbi:hypothetical protein JCM1841_006573 [Sporobolomyces salmonicolor]
MSFSDDGAAPYDELGYWGADFSSGTPAANPWGIPVAAPSTSASPNAEVTDKGKGKAVDVADEVMDSTEATGSSTESTKQAREDLARLAAVDPTTAGRLAELDPTPIDTLPTSLKLIKAIQILTNACSSALDALPAPAQTYAGQVDLPAVDGLPISRYTSAIELLTSALSDVNLNAPTMRSPPKEHASYHLEVARAKLGLPLQDAVPPMPLPARPPTLISGRSVHVVDPYRHPPSDIALLFAENARLALAALRPSVLFPPLPPTVPSSPPPAASSRSGSLSAMGPSPISKLPAELLVHIFSLARSVAAERSPDSDLPPPGVEVIEAWGGGLRGRRSVTRQYSALNRTNALEGDNAAAQRFALALARVCKAWVDPAQTVAFRTLHLHQGPQLADLLSLLTSRPELSHLASHIRSISAGIAPLPPADSSTSAGDRLHRPFAYRAAARLRGTRAGCSVSMSKTQGEGVGEGERESAGEMWSRLVALAGNVQKLRLRIIASRRWGVPHGRGASSSADFLEAPVLACLSSTTTLRHLHLSFCIDFDELEVVLNALPSLESLTVRAIDNISGAGTVASAGPHLARNLRSLKIGDMSSSSPYHIQDYSTLTDVQLCWLLEPAVDSGALKEVEVVLLVDASAPFGGTWNVLLGGGGAAVAAAGGANVLPPPFASGLFADLMVRGGDKLEKLVLQDWSESGTASRNSLSLSLLRDGLLSFRLTLALPRLDDASQIFPSLANAPHHSNFDHVLSHLTSLHTLQLQFAYTGPNFLPSIDITPLRSLSLSGTPVHTSATAFADQLEHGFSGLENLGISGEYVGSRGGAPGGWSGAGLRRIKQAAKDRGLQVAFGGPM